MEGDGDFSGAEAPEIIDLAAEQHASPTRYSSGGDRSADGSDQSEGERGSEGGSDDDDEDDDHDDFVARDDLPEEQACPAKQLTLSGSHVSVCIAGSVSMATSSCIHLQAMS